ncbi:MAG TPA: caspase family protein [Flavobacteriales bacterium]|nr:caspase family protein [Flavobacteriales bacterium]
MKKGISIHLGLNSIDPKHYGTDGQLKGCENDANSMEKIAATAGFKTIKLLTQKATSARLLSELMQASRDLSAGDTLLLTYAGHGSQIKDITGEEPDSYDETWCLYDRMLIDDELYKAWSNFKQGVRILVISDSCHSGTVTRLVLENELYKTAYNNNVIYRCFDPEKAQEICNKYEYIYSGLKFGVPREMETNIKASVLLISGCQDNQLSGDGASNGIFTGNLLKAWNNGGFMGTYKSFHSQILTLMPPFQTPNYFYVGAANSVFESERPFTIEHASRTHMDKIDTNARNISWKIDLDDQILCQMDPTELSAYLRDVVISPMVESYHNLKLLSSQVVFPRGFDGGCSVSADTKGNIEVHCGGKF